MALTLHKFEKEMHCFTLDGIVDKDALIVIIFTREVWKYRVVFKLFSKKLLRN